MKMTSEQEQQEIAMGRPTKFRPDWPPGASRRPLPKISMKCSEEFKKVEWPPKQEVDSKVEVPVSTFQLGDEIPLNDERWKPCGEYKIAPGIYAEQPAQLSDDVWPPPEAIDTSERVIRDDSRKKRVHRDYTVHFNKNKGPEPNKSYKVPPGTLHVISQRGVLQFDNVDIGRAGMAEPDQKQKKQQQQSQSQPQQAQAQPPQLQKPHPQYQNNDGERSEEEEVSDEEEEADEESAAESL